MGAHSTYDTLNKRLGGQLPKYLRVRRARKEPLYRIAAEIGETYDVWVSPETIRVWCERAK